MPKGSPTPRPSAAEATPEVRLINVHKPALGFERSFRRFHTLIRSGQMKLPPKDPRSVFLISMLFSDHPREIISVKPSRGFMKGMAFIGRHLLRYKLPP